MFVSQLIFTVYLFYLFRDYFHIVVCRARHSNINNVLYIGGFQGASTSQVIGARNEMIKDDYDGEMMFGDLVGLQLPDIRLTGEEKPRKTSPRKRVPTGNRTLARCVANAHATTCSTAVDYY